MAASHALREGGAAAGTQPQRSVSNLAALARYYAGPKRRTTLSVGRDRWFGCLPPDLRAPIDGVTRTDRPADHPRERPPRV
jgi:hypothetical protein